MRKCWGKPVRNTIHLFRHEGNHHRDYTPTLQVILYQCMLCGCNSRFSMQYLLRRDQCQNLSNSRTTWKFNPPNAPHMDAWEKANQNSEDNHERHDLTKASKKSNTWGTYHSYVGNVYYCQQQIAYVCAMRHELAAYAYSFHVTYYEDFTRYQSIPIHWLQTIRIHRNLVHQM